MEVQRLVLTKPQKPSESIVALPRAQRRAIWAQARRGSSDLSSNWEDYRRWDGGKPNILRGYDVLRDLKETRRREAREARAAGHVGSLLSGMLGGALKGLNRHRMFRRKAS